MSKLSLRIADGVAREVHRRLCRCGLGGEERTDLRTNASDEIVEAMTGGEAHLRAHVEELRERRVGRRASGPPLVTHARFEADEDEAVAAMTEGEALRRVNRARR